MDIRYELAAPRSNLELKARLDADLHARILGIAETLSDVPLRCLIQVDTYFTVASGRLKIRETSGEEQAAELIGYHRSDSDGARWSRYHRVPLEPGAAAGAISALADTAGILGVVRKVRWVAIVRRTRIHIDTVEGLGHFAELETVVDDPADTTAAAELASVAQALGIDRLPAIPGSYSDLIVTVDKNGEEAP